jgi:SAM-dependent methyltransferase
MNPLFCAEDEYASGEAGRQIKRMTARGPAAYKLGAILRFAKGTLTFMATPTGTHKASPEKIFSSLNGYQQTAALRTAIELDLFTAIGDGAQDAKSIAEKVQASERGTRILCDYLVIQGFLLKDSRKYQLPEDSAVFLSKHSPAYLGSIVGFLSLPWHSNNFLKLTEVVRRGGSVDGTGDNSKPNDEAWVAFARSMGPMMAPAARFMAGLMDAAAGKPMKVLDVAAGHGMFGVTIARENANAQITAVDWPAVLEVAKENAEKTGVGGRYTVRAGSVFEIDLGAGYDYVLLTNILHHFDVPTCEILLRRVHAALKPGGKAVTLEFVPNEDRVSPPAAASFSLVMLTNTAAGDAYTFAEYCSMFASAGFGKTTMAAVPGTTETVLVSERGV